MRYFKFVLDLNRVMDIDFVVISFEMHILMPQSIAKIGIKTICYVI